MKPGLYANIHAKKKRIADGSGEKMRKPGTKGAPTKKAFIAINIKIFATGRRIYNGSINIFIKNPFNAEKQPY